MANEKKGAIERFAESAFMKKLQVGSQKLASNEIFSTISGAPSAPMYSNSKRCGSWKSS